MLFRSLLRDQDLEKIWAFRNGICHDVDQVVRPKARGTLNTPPSTRRDYGHGSYIGSGMVMKVGLIDK